MHTCRGGKHSISARKECGMLVTRGSKSRAKGCIEQSSSNTVIAPRSTCSQPHSSGTNPNRNEHRNCVLAGCAPRRTQHGSHTWRVRQCLLPRRPRAFGRLPPFCLPRRRTGKQTLWHFLFLFRVRVTSGPFAKHFVCDRQTTCPTQFTPSFCTVHITNVLLHQTCSVLRVRPWARAPQVDGGSSWRHA